MTNVIVSYTINLVETRFIASPKTHRVSTKTSLCPRFAAVKLAVSTLRGAQPHNCKTPLRGNRELLGITHQANTSTEVSAVEVARVEVKIVEVHVARAAIAV